MADQVRRDLPAFGSEAELVAACRRLRRHLERWQGVDEEEIARWWPSDEGAAGLWEWVSTHGQMMRLMGVSNGGGTGGGSSIDRADEAARAALLDEPEQVTLSDGSSVQVMPQSYTSLQWFLQRDGWLSILAEKRQVLEIALSGAGDLSVPAGSCYALLDRIRAEEVAILGLLCARACAPGTAEHVPGARGYMLRCLKRLGLRVGDVLTGADIRRFVRLSPADLLAIYGAHIRVNHVRVLLAQELAPPRASRNDNRPRTWAAWLAGQAHLQRGNPNALRTVAVDRSLPSQLVEIALSAPADTLLDE